MAGKVEGKGQAKILTPQEVEQVIHYAREPCRIAIAIAAYTGCRMSEAISLRRESILRDSIVFTKTKTGKNRTVPLHPKLKAILADVDLPGSGYFHPMAGSGCPT